MGTTLESIGDAECLVWLDAMRPASEHDRRPMTARPVRLLGARNHSSVVWISDWTSEVVSDARSNQRSLIESGGADVNVPTVPTVSIEQYPQQGPLLTLDNRLLECLVRGLGAVGTYPVSGRERGWRGARWQEGNQNRKRPVSQLRPQVA